MQMKNILMNENIRAIFRVIIAPIRLCFYMLVLWVKLCFIFYGLLLLPLAFISIYFLHSTLGAWVFVIQGFILGIATYLFLWLRKTENRIQMLRETFVLTKFKLITDLFISGVAGAMCYVAVIYSLEPLGDLLNKIYTLIVTLLEFTTTLLASIKTIITSNKETIVIVIIVALLTSIKKKLVDIQEAIANHRCTSKSADSWQEKR